jgi:signal transduction histidine kinase
MGLTKIALLIFPVALVSIGAYAQTAVSTPRTIRVVMDNSYAPYSFSSDDGTLQGILVDEWRSWEKKTGNKVEIHAMDWDEALRRTRAGEFDVIESIVETPERDKSFDFSPPYATIEASIFFRNDIAGITDLKSLRGFPVGAKAGDQHIDTLREDGVTTVILFPNNGAIIQAAKQRKINVFVVDVLSALYLLNRAGIESHFRHSAPIARDELRRAVRRGDTALLRTITEGFDAIGSGELKAIDEKWFGRTINGYGRYLIYAGYAAAAAIVLIAILAAWNRTLRKRIQQRTAALEATTEKLRALSARIQSAREEEGIRIARAIHDELGSVLTSLRWDLAGIAKLFPESDQQPPAPDLRDRIAGMLGLTDTTIDVVRRIASELRPEVLDVLGLIETIAWHAKQFQDRTGIDVRCASSLNDPDLSPEQSIAVFRIFQEALTNILRHARASRVDVTMMDEAGTFVLTIKDNGRGITAEEKSGRSAIGLLGMRERALLIGGVIDISGIEREGTTVTLSLPIVMSS